MLLGGESILASPSDVCGRESSRVEVEANRFTLTFPFRDAVGACERLKLVDSCRCIK